MIACEGPGAAPAGAKKVILGIGTAAPVAAVGHFGDAIAAHRKGGAILALRSEMLRLKLRTRN